LQDGHVSVSVVSQIPLHTDSASLHRGTCSLAAASGLIAVSTGTACGDVYLFETDTGRLLGSGHLGAVCSLHDARLLAGPARPSAFGRQC
jgi:hypothetical protein